MSLSAAEVYTRFRTGKAFLIFMTLFIAFWMIWNSVPWVNHFDSVNGWPKLNLILSMESSMFGTIVIMALEKSDKLQKEQIIAIRDLQESQQEQIIYIRHLLEAQIMLLKSDHVANKGTPDPAPAIRLDSGVDEKDVT